MPLVRETALLIKYHKTRKKGQVKKCKRKSHIAVDSKGKKFMKKCSLSLNNLSISFTCVETVI